MTLCSLLPFPYPQARNVDDFKKQQAAKAQDTLRKQMEEKQQRDRELAEMLKNKIDDTYFGQFGTSHR